METKTAGVTKIVIAGGGTSGWMCAAALAHFLPPQNYSITLIESSKIGTVGVGEATLPHLRHFNQTLGIDENDFMRKTNATYKMGIQFNNWGNIGDTYIHPFGEYGVPIDDIAFHHFWLDQHSSGYTPALSEFSFPVVAANAQKFEYPSEDQKSIQSTYSYAFHLDAALYARYLRAYSEKRGLLRVEDEIAHVKTNPANGDIASLALSSGTEIEGDLFIDCTGMQALLIGRTLNVPYHSWSKWLPCDRALAVATKSNNHPPPYTKATAQEAGWQWEIPLQHRTGNGLVYSSSHMNDDQAHQVLLGNLSSSILSTPLSIKFQVGHRPVSWKKNCIAVGLSAGFLEPLESTGLHLVQTAITQLLEFLPSDHNQIDKLRREFNRIMEHKFLSVRDFLILHYHITQRNDSEFWRYCRNMSIPEALKYKIELFSKRGYIVEDHDGLFLQPSWVAVYFGQNLLPNQPHPSVAEYPKEKIKLFLNQHRALISKAAANLPSHREAIAKCHSDQPDNSPKAQLNLYGRHECEFW